MTKINAHDTVHAFASAGGKARAKALTKEQRGAIAKKAAKSRWKSHIAK